MVKELGLLSEMDLKGSVCVAVFLCLNLLSVSMVTSQTCLMNMVGLRACSGLLNLSLIVGSPSDCCDTLQGMGAHAGVCLCTALKANVHGIIPDLSELSLIYNTTLSTCEMPTSEFDQCP